jgi:diguanylate cyclase (GGDEF)-like protein
VQKVLDMIPAHVYIMDLKTYEILFANASVKKAAGEDCVGKKCYEAMQRRDTPCELDRCNRERILDANGKPHGVVEVEMLSATAHRWMLNRDQAFYWFDGRLVMLGLALDVQELKDAREELRRLASTDDLTQLLNRRQFHAIAGGEVERALRYKRQLSLLMADVDYFKKINDTFGHQAGDKVLARLAECFFDSLRNSDYAFRMGGEEFAILLPDTDLDSALMTAERIREKVDEQVIETAKGEVQITLSIGGASLQSNHRDLDDLFAAADDALYRAKKLGRNKVVA